MTTKKKTTKKKITKKKPMPSKTINTQELEKMFVEEYLANGFNQSEAYSAVVVKKKKLKPANATLNNSAYLYMRREGVKKYLAQRLEERKKELHIDQTYVVRKMLEIVEADYVSATHYLTSEELENMPKKLRRLIVSIDAEHKEHSYNRYNEDHNEVTQRYKVTFMSKDKALDGLAKHTGTYAKDNISLTGDLSQKSFTDAMKELDI